MFIVFLFCNLLIMGCGKQPKSMGDKANYIGATVNKENLDTATFAAGCFWCVEAVFQRVKGVVSVHSGYSGGQKVNPSYEDVCTGTTGHAEACQIVFDTTQVSYQDLLEIFWGSHDPTTLNKQGADVGTQYRSAIFYNSEKQKELAEHYRLKLDQSNTFTNPVVTQIAPLTNFYPAENYHQDYYNSHSNQPYCSFVITPKLEKFRKVFHDRLKEDEK